MFSRVSSRKSRQQRSTRRASGVNQFFLFYNFPLTEDIYSDNSSQVAGIATAEKESRMTTNKASYSLSPPKTQQTYKLHSSVKPRTSIPLQMSKTRAEQGQP